MSMKLHPSEYILATAALIMLLGLSDCAGATHAVDTAVILLEDR